MDRRKKNESNNKNNSNNANKNSFDAENNLSTYDFSSTKEKLNNIQAAITNSPSEETKGLVGNVYEIGRAHV